MDEWMNGCQVQNGGDQAMDRQVSEGCYIKSPQADLLMDGKVDHMQPVVGRIYGCIYIVAVYNLYKLTAVNNDGCAQWEKEGEKYLLNQ